MKAIIPSFLLLFFAQLVFGQDWQPIYLNETIYYTSSLDTEESFGVFAADLSFESDSSDVKITLNVDTVETCPCIQNVCRLIKANFLQSKIVYSDSGVVVFQNPDTLTFHTLAQIDDSWLFKNNDENGEITATIISESVMDVLSQTDSVKTIALSNGEEIDLSKNHGITRWSKPEFTLSIHSIPKRGLGEVYLTKAEVYDFEVGDIFAYVIDNYSGQNHGAAAETYSRRYVVRFDVISIDEQEPIRTITVLRHYVKKYYYEYDPYYGSSYSDNYLESKIDTIVLEINLESFDPLYELPENNYWTKPARMNLNQDFVSNMISLTFDNDYGYFFGQGYNLTASAMHHKSFNNRRALHFGFASFEIPFTPLNTLSDFMSYANVNYLGWSENIDYLLYGCDYSYCDNPDILPGEILDIANEYNYYNNTCRQSATSVVEGIGVVEFYNQIFEFEFNEGVKAKLIGYKKGEETMGFIPDVSAIMSVGIEDAKRQIGFSVFPNPANDRVRIHIPQSGKTQLTIFDISGRVIMQTDFGSNEMEINTGDFVSGLYFIQVETPEGRGVEKLIISR